MSYFTFHPVFQQFHGILNQAELANTGMTWLRLLRQCTVKHLGIVTEKVVAVYPFDSTAPAIFGW